MELLGLDSREILPPKIWRAIMLYRCGLPITDYLIIDLYKVAEKEAVRHLLDRLVKSKHGAVVKTVTWEDGKNQPYQWLRRADQRTISRVVNKSLRQYLMAFAPLTNPRKANGFTVGRYALLSDETRIIEYMQGEIQPRKLEYITTEQTTNGRYGVLTKNPGRLFLASPPGNIAAQILSALNAYEDAVALLKSTIRENINHRASGRDEICLEFILNNSTEAVEFYDFDM